MRRRTTALREDIKEPNVNLLSIGPGHAVAELQILRQLRGAKLHTIDIAKVKPIWDVLAIEAKRDNREKTIEHAHRQVQGSAEALPYLDNSMHIAVSAFALDHATNPDRAASELHRVLAPGGGAVILLTKYSDEFPEDFKKTLASLRPTLRALKKANAPAAKIKEAEIGIAGTEALLHSARNLPKNVNEAKRHFEKHGFKVTEAVELAGDNAAMGLVLRKPTA